MEKTVERVRQSDKQNSLPNPGRFSKWFVVFALGALGLFCLKQYGSFHLMTQRDILGIAGVLFALTFAYIFELTSNFKLEKRISKFLEFFGRMTLELYLAHLTARYIYSKFFMTGKGHLSEYYLFVLVAIVVAVVVRFICDKTPSLIKKLLPNKSATI